MVCSSRRSSDQAVGVERLYRPPWRMVNRQKQRLLAAAFFCVVGLAQGRGPTPAAAKWRLRLPAHRYIKQLRFVLHITRRDERRDYEQTHLLVVAGCRERQAHGECLVGGARAGAAY